MYPMQKSMERKPIPSNTAARIHLSNMHKGGNTMYLYKIKLNGYKRSKKEWFVEPLIIGHTYAGSAGQSSWTLFEVIELLETID